MAGHRGAQGIHDAGSGVTPSSTASAGKSRSAPPGHRRNRRVGLPARAPNGLPTFPRAVVRRRRSSAGSEISAGSPRDRGLGRPTIVLEARGGTCGSSDARNTEYAEGLGCGFALTDAALDTHETAHLPLETRRRVDLRQPSQLDVSETRRADHVSRSCSRPQRRRRPSACPSSSVSSPTRAAGTSIAQAVSIPRRVDRRRRPLDLRQGARQRREPLLAGLNRLRGLNDERTRMVHRLLSAEHLPHRAVELGLAVLDEEAQHKRAVEQAPRARRRCLSACLRASVRDKLRRVMEHEELERILQNRTGGQADESDRVELTESLKKFDKFGEALCAFANDLPKHGRPGYLFVGASADGRASGEIISDELLRQLADMRNNGNLLPPPRMNVQKLSLGGGEMAVVEVFPSDLPPVRYKGQVWVRVGPSRRVATESEERELSERRAAQAKTWDARPCHEAALDDLVLDLFVLSYRPLAVSRRVIAENHRSIEDQLAALRFFDRRAGCPTNAGVLLFSSRSRGFFPGAYVQYVRYAGESLSSEVLREREIDGDLLTVMRELDGLGDDLAGGRPVALGRGAAERTAYDYPPRALHELLMNAVIHRNYESNTPIMINHFVDRVELTNPGGLYGDLTPEEFPGATAYRNPVLAEAAKVLGFVNRFGRGILTAEDELRRNGSPSASFTPRANHFHVVIARPA